MGLKSSSSTPNWKKLFLYGQGYSHVETGEDLPQTVVTKVEAHYYLSNIALYFRPKAHKRV